MQFKDHTQTWPTRRAQRCLSFAILFILISLFGIYEQYSWPPNTELQLDRIKDLYAPYSYSSIPEEGMPRLPFKNNARRKATEEPWFEWVYEEEEVQEEPLVFTPDEMEHGKLIGVQPQ